MPKSPKERKRTENALLVTIAEAAQRLSISQRTVWNLISTGRLEAVRIGRAVRLRAAQVASVAEEGAATC